MFEVAQELANKSINFLNNTMKNMIKWLIIFQELQNII